MLTKSKLPLTNQSQLKKRALNPSLTLEFEWGGQNLVGSAHPLNFEGVGHDLPKFTLTPSMCTVKSRNAQIANRSQEKPREAKSGIGIPLEGFQRQRLRKARHLNFRIVPCLVPEF